MPKIGRFIDMPEESEILHATDIVGKQIAAVTILPDTPGDDVSGYRAFVRLTDGVQFELSFGEGQPIRKWTGKLGESARSGIVLDCVGERIVAVVMGETSPFFGLLLTSRRILRIGAIPPTHYGPILDDLDEVKDFGEVTDFWTGEQY